MGTRSRRKLDGSAPSSGRRLHGIEGLRGTAAMLVLFHHTGSHLGKDAGVLYELSKLSVHGLTLFFALSGFLLFRPFAESLVSGKSAPSWKRYARNRAVRIYPAYIVILLLVSVVFGAAYTSGAPDLNQPDPSGFILDPATLAINALLIQTYIPGFILTGIGPAWSLTAEIAFYLLLPLICWAMGQAAARGVNKWLAIAAPIALMIFTGLALTVWSGIARRSLDSHGKSEFSWGQTWTAVVERSFFAQADLFAYGMIAAAVLTAVRTGSFTIGRRTKSALAFGFVLVTVINSLGFIPAISGNVAGVTAATLIFLVALPSDRHRRPINRLAKALEFAPLNYVGLTSYSVYLWHIPVIWWFKERGMVFGPGADGLALNTLLVAVVSAILASVTFYLVEKPAMNLKNRRRADPRIQGPAPELTPSNGGK